MVRHNNQIIFKDTMEDNYLLCTKKKISLCIGMVNMRAKIGTPFCPGLKNAKGPKL